MPSTPRTRKRVRPLRRDSFRYGWGGWNAPRDGTVRIDGTQMTVSEGHPWTGDGFKGEDVGGNFYSIQRRYGDGRSSLNNPQPQYIFGTPAPYTMFYYGPLYAAQPAIVGTGHNLYGLHEFKESVFPPDLSYSDSYLNGLGATAIANCKPTSSPANLSVGIAELVREGIPRALGANLWESRAKDFRRYGDEYLNYQFGWLPLVNDIKDTASAISNASKLMKQYERDSGRLVRRGYDFPLIRETETIPARNEVFMANNVLKGDWYANGSASRCRGFREREITRKIWFRGGFTYYLPSDYDSRSKLDRASLFATDILGLEITPETIWNLTPWSWAVDWGTNIGDVMANISDFAADGLVLRYGYLMENTIIKDTYTVTGADLVGYGPTTIRTTFVTEVKKRRRATPFGFGFDMTKLNSRQIAILAALGISRVPR